MQMSELRFKPGRELDALVAEKVMGWGPESPGVLQAKGFKQDPYPPFSTSIADAWRVADKLYQLGWSLTIEMANWSAVEVKLVDVSRDLIRDNVYITEAESAPHAICLAALKVVARSW